MLIVAAAALAALAARLYYVGHVAPVRSTNAQEEAIRDAQALAHLRQVGAAVRRVREANHRRPFGR